jgi:hypothetical protein
MALLMGMAVVSNVTPAVEGSNNDNFLMFLQMTLLMRQKSMTRQLVVNL